MRNICVAIFCILFFSSCDSDKKSELFAKYLNDNYSLDVYNKDLIFLIYTEDGCKSCNVDFEIYLDTLNNIPDNMYIIYLSSYPAISRFNHWKNKYKDQLLWDRTNYLSKAGIKNSLGRIVWKKNAIVSEEEFDYQNVNEIYSLLEKANNCFFNKKKCNKAGYGQFKAYS